MGKQLKDNLSSAYFEAANRLQGRKARKRIVAYVEAYDDIFFWRTALSRFENEHRYFEVMLPSRHTLTKGKRSVLMNLISGNVGESMIACVDADYDYLLQETTATSRTVNHNPYVFHTYAYAIENLQCCAESLHDVGVAVTLNDKPIFDFEEYLRLYSEARSTVIGHMSSVKLLGLRVYNISIVCLEYMVLQEWYLWKVLHYRF